MIWVLFGNPIDQNDRGLLGRLQDDQREIRRLVRQLVGVAWAILLVFLAALVTATTDLILNVHK